MEKQIKFAAKQVQGGWTVVKQVGSKRTGRQEYATDVGILGSMHTACAIANQMTRDYSE